MRPALDLSGSLQVHTPAGAVGVQARYAVIDLTLPSLRTGLILLRSRPVRASYLRGLDAWLRASGLSLRIEVRGREIARLGVNAGAGIVSRLLGLAPLQINLSSLGGAIVGRTTPKADTGDP
jgi:hypothetical protein